MKVVSLMKIWDDQRKVQLVDDELNLIKKNNDIAIFVVVVSWERLENKT